MGQLASMGIVSISLGLSDSLLQLPTIFTIDSFLILIFAVLFWVFIRKTLPSPAGLERVNDLLFFTPISDLVRSSVRTSKNYFCEEPLFNILSLGIFLNGLMFHVELQVDDWSGFFKSVTKDIYYSYKNDNLDLLVQIESLSTDCATRILNFVFYDCIPLCQILYDSTGCFRAR